MTSSTKLVSHLLSTQLTRHCTQSACLASKFFSYWSPILILAQNNGLPLALFSLPVELPKQPLRLLTSIIGSRNFIGCWGCLGDTG